VKCFLVAIDMIERSFIANGFAIIQLDPETVEIVGVGRNARSSGVPAISDPKQLPEHERLISCLFQFRRADAKAIQQLFAQYLSPPRAYTSFLLSSDAHVLWVTERTSVIRQLLVVAEKLDVPPEQPSHAER
jgi:hypothetical protein